MDCSSLFHDTNGRFPQRIASTVRRCVTFVRQLGQWLIHSNVGGGSNQLGVGEGDGDRLYILEYP